MQDKDYLLRCIQIAKSGGKDVRPNPQVGAIIVHDNRIIGEGYHQRFGEAHAEVNAINNVAEVDQHLIDKSTIYVSLEPCCHTGNTPPCVDLIIKHKIPSVCIAEIDPTDKVNSKGIAKLKAHGIQVDIIPMDTYAISSVFKANHLKQRPFIQIKLAKSSDNYIGETEKQVYLTNNKTNIYTHKLRAQTDGILIGTNTAVVDDPSLTLRNYPGQSPMRIVMDRNGRIPETHTLLSDENACIIINQHNRTGLKKNKEQVQLNFDAEDFLDSMLTTLLRKGIYHLMVEGGASLIKSFLKANLWDEAIVINTSKKMSSGIKAPNINGRLTSQFKMDDDEIHVVCNPNS